MSNVDFSLWILTQKLTELTLINYTVDDDAQLNCDMLLQSQCASHPRAPRLQPPTIRRVTHEPLHFAFYHCISDDFRSLAAQ
jgi:hypothetical protein